MKLTGNNMKQPVFTESAKDGVSMIQVAISDFIEESTKNDGYNEEDVQDMREAQKWLSKMLAWRRQLEQQVPDGYLK